MYLRPHSTGPGLLATFYSVGWSVELSSGSTVMSGLAGFGLAALMTLPESPVSPAIRRPLAERSEV